MHDRTRTDKMAIVMAASHRRMGSYFKREVRGPPFTGNEEMQYEGIRLITFKDWPSWGAVWPTLLAKARFFYTKTADQVACFCCGGRLKTWEAGDSPMNEHKRFFPQCSFVTGRDSSNVPLGEAAKEHLCITAPGDCRQNEPPSVVRLSSAGLGQESVPVSMHKLQEMMLERDRLESYRDWPPSAYACPETLAKTSLYYTGIADHVRCAFCNVTLCDWKPDDVPLLKHLTSFPSCAFLEGPGPAGNVLTGDTNANSQQLSQMSLMLSYINKLGEVHFM